MEEVGENKTGTRWQRMQERLHESYRLVVMNEETFEEVRSFKLSLLNVYLVLSSIIVVVAVSVIALLAFTPLKKYIPGFGDVVQREEVTALYEEVDRLEQELEAQQAYTDNFRKLILGDYETEEEAMTDLTEEELAMQDSLEQVTLSAAEIQLRREMELEAVGRQARSGENGPIAGSQDVPLAQLFFVPPVRGEVSAGFKPDEAHYGVDVIGPKGTAVKAAMDGYVILSDYTYETGHTIGIQHSNNVITFYKHNAELLKEVGSMVKAGEAIAIIGNTGHQTTGPHLHFELWHRGLPVDPYEYIKF